MCSARRLRLPVMAGLFLLAGCLAGCHPVAKSWPGPVSKAPIPTDEAMLRRDWPRVVARYENGSVIAGPTGFPLEPSENLTFWQAPIVEPALLVGQSVLLPITLVLVPPWTETVYSGVVVPPTYTAAVPLPRPSRPDP